MEKIDVKKVIACVDGSKWSQSISAYGAFFSKTLLCPLDLLHTIEHPHTASSLDLSGNLNLGARDALLQTLISEEENESKERIKRGRVFLETFLKQAHDEGAHPVSIVQRHGNLYETLLEMESNIRVLILGLRGEDHEGETFSIGAQVEEIIRSLHVPILLINQAFKVPQKILIAYDGSASSKKALEMVGKEPLFTNVERHIVNVHKNKETSEALLHEACSLLGKYTSAKVQSISLQGEPVDALVAYQESMHIDLMAMGAFSHHRLRDALMGSFTLKLLAQTKKPLLLLR